MVRNKIIRRILLFFWAAILMHVAVGSLINFHQHKIWHKELLPQYFVTNRDKDKSLKILNLKHGPKILTDLQTGTFIFSSRTDFNPFFDQSCSRLIPSADAFTLPDYSPGGNGLRAPPAI
jgi:hypothetical protein